MILPEAIFNNYTLNIFTDATVLTPKNKKFTNDERGYAYCGAMAFDGYPSNIRHIDSVSSQYILPIKDTNLAEIISINMAVECALKYKENYAHINIFSDSKIAVLQLKKDPCYWIFNENNEVINRYKKRKIPYLKPQIIKIAKTIIQNELPISLYYSPAHHDETNEVSIMDAAYLYTTVNEISYPVSRDLIKLLIQYNNDIDMYLALQAKNKEFRASYMDFTGCGTITINELDQYKKIVLGGNQYGW